MNMANYKCDNCGETLFTKRAKKCRRCAGLASSPPKIVWPSNSVLAKMVEKDGVAKTARNLGVSHSTVRKRLGR